MEYNFEATLAKSAPTSNINTSVDHIVDYYKLPIIIIFVNFN